MCCGLVQSAPAASTPRRADRISVQPALAEKLKGRSAFVRETVTSTYWGTPGRVTAQKHLSPLVRHRSLGIESGLAGQRLDGRMSSSVQASSAGEVDGAAGRARRAVAAAVLVPDVAPPGPEVVDVVLDVPPPQPANASSNPAAPIERTRIDRSSMTATRSEEGYALGRAADHQRRDTLGMTDGPGRARPASGKLAHPRAAGG